MVADGDKKASVVVLAGGGPAPGINAVIASVIRSFSRGGYRVLGLHGGVRGIFESDPDFIGMGLPLADEILDCGGSYLRMSRYKPTDADFENFFNIEFFRDNNVSLLVTIGGDDTATTANRISEFLARHNYPVANIHVPKTIDNDLPLPAGTPTFGFESAKDGGARTARALYRDAKASGNWFVVCSMGRSAGHLALAIGAACHYPMIIIPEMFSKTAISLDKITRLAVSSIVKRKMLGLDYGAVMVSEGVFHLLNAEELADAGYIFSTDDHGHIEMGRHAKAQLFSDILDKALETAGLGVRTRPVDIGYDVRCIPPTGYDLFYCTRLGCGVYELFSQGHSGCMVYADPLGNVRPLHLDSLKDPATGRIQPRLVDMESGTAKGVFENLLDYIAPQDYERALAFVGEPEKYDFHKILEW